MIRVFIGTSPNHEDAESQAVVEWTIRKHASEPVEIRWLRLEREGPLSGWNSSEWATPFTGFRWAVPELCGFEGRGIYCDSDFIFLADIAELWHQPIPDGSVCLAKSTKRMCIILWDCARARGHVPPIEDLRRDPLGHLKARSHFETIPALVAPFRGNWNCLDGDEAPVLESPAVKATHYTRMATQPHLPRARARLAASGHGHWFDGAPRVHPRNDLVALFERELAEAESNGYGVERYLTQPTYGPYRKRNVGHLAGAR